jgi:uncharacterized membrane protein YtjA (UPF0391 family)
MLYESMPMCGAGLKRNRAAARIVVTASLSSHGVEIMLRWALFFLVISLIAALFGFTGISVAAAGIAKVLFFLFIVITVVLFALVIAAGRALRG